MRIFNRKLRAFSLAEMMVVMLIVTIVLAATAPMITKKVSRERSNKVFDKLPSDAQVAAEYIGGKNQRLYMNAYENGYVGIRKEGDIIPKNSVLFGYNSYSGLNPTGFVGIGFNTENGANSVAVGYAATTGKNSIAIGYNSKNNSNPDSSIAIGYNIITEGADALAIGHNTDNTKVSAKNKGSISLGYNTYAEGRSIAIGQETSSKESIVIGDRSESKSSDNIILGDYTKIENAKHSIAIGYEARVRRSGMAAHFLSDVKNAVAIGYQARATKSNTIVLGNADATVYIPGNLVVGKVTLVGADSVDETGKSIANYPLIYRPAGFTNGDDEGLARMFTALTAVDDYKGDSDGAVSYYYDNSTSAYREGVQVGPYIRPQKKPSGAHWKDNNKACMQWYSSSGTYSFHTAKKPHWCSDIRLKNVGDEYTGGLDELSKLKFYHFTFKKDVTKTPQVGVMAQDLQKVFPDAVEADSDGYLSIRWDEMFYAALNAIKELNNKVTAISEKLKTVTEDIISLKNVTQKHQETIDAQAKLIDEQQAELKDLTKRIEKLERSKK
ncbi:MAG: tail fiber domain-containing protein [Candidatus Gastranaerophilaceae bacterium]